VVFKPRVKTAGVMDDKRGEPTEEDVTGTRKEESEIEKLQCG